MKINPKSLYDFHDLKCWKIYSQKSSYEESLYLKDFNHIYFLGRYFIDFDGDHSFFNGVVGTIRDAIFLNGGDLHAAFDRDL